MNGISLFWLNYLLSLLDEKKYEDLKLILFFRTIILQNHSYKR